MATLSVGEKLLSDVANGRRVATVPASAAMRRRAALPAAASSARPSLLLEPRAALELAELVASPVYYGVGVPRGDGAPVLLLPGFMGSDSYLLVLHGWLLRVGYRPYSSNLGWCVGSVVKLAVRAVRRVEEVAAATGRPITLIGHSLGGILSCMVARQRPELVAHVVTLGSALCDDPRGASHPLVVALGDLLAWDGATVPPPAEARDGDRELFGAPLPPGIALTSIYSRDDAVVDWRACIADRPNTAAYEVRGSHSGLAWNAAVYRHLGRELSRA